jgi:DNA-binding response OmpR family regulator
LVVDDDPDILLLVCANVRAWGHECRQAGNGEEAKQMCREMTPDVMLLDVAMPGMDGPSLFRELQAEDLAPPRVVLLSALPPTDVETIAAELGVGWMSKPFTAPAFREACARLIPGLVA